jgi:hypothetical protein
MSTNDYGYPKTGMLTESLIGTSTGTKAVQTANDFRRFKTYKGLPPDGEPGIFLGWDANHQPWTLVWQPEDGIRNGYWGAVGWERDNESVQPDRAMYKALKEQWADFIVEWAFSPVCPPLKVWPEEARTNQDSGATLQDWKHKFANELYKKSVLNKSTTRMMPKRGI